MRAAKNLAVDNKLLQELVPLNALSAQRFRELLEKVIIEEVLAGRYLFRKGDRDNQSIYLLEGKVNLIDGFRKITSEVEAGTDISRYPIANQQPRSLAARAVNKVVVAKIDSGLLDVFLTWDQSSTAEVFEIGAETNEDWMTRILQSEAFIHIPPSKIQSLLMKMESLPVKAGDTIIRQGDSGDYFYTIHEGRCAVTRQDSPDGEPQLLAELGEGDSFGEDALLSDGERNATVSVLADGMLMRLAKRDFIELLNNQLVRRVNYEQAAAMVDDGAIWVDVRTVDEYKNGAFEDSVNIPLFRLRNELSELVFNSKYIMCCDTGRRSESAGFLLGHKGFDVYVLEGGIPGLSSSAIESPEEVHTGDTCTEGVAGEVDNAGAMHEFPGQTDAGDSFAGDGQDDTAGPEAAKDDVVIQQPAEVESLLEDLRSENEALTAQLETYQAPEECITEQLLAMESAAQQQQSDEQIRVLQEALERQQQQLSEASAVQVAANESLQALQRDNEILRTQLRDTSVQLDEQRELLENLLADKQVLNEAAQRQQSEWDAERTALQQALVGEQQIVTGLREELSSAVMQSSEDKSALEAELKALLDKSNEKNERLEITQVELKRDRSRLDDELQTVLTGREQLQQQLADSAAQKQQLESEIESLRQEAESVASASNEQLQQLQSQLQEVQEKTSAVEKQDEEQLAYRNSLQEQLALRESESEIFQQHREELQQQLSDLQLQLEQQEDRAKALEDEHNASLQKAHEDLTRKNDNEKELQGQIDRLRKKVEQQTTDHQKAREDAREDVDNLRDQLHAERQARAEERSEMAARQRELKEQLALIAKEHETNLSNHNGAIEQARDVARQEEQERVRVLLATHVETEDQVNRLQQELKKAHDEIAALAREEKDRRKIDIDLMEEQNQQALATISQLESQLKQYTEERDTALQEQQSLRDRMNALRGEVEVARGLMGVSEQVEDPAKLRSELNESKKNVEIALRLRAEAEAACERLRQERDSLQQQLHSAEVPGEPIHVPSLDEKVSNSVHPGPEQYTRQAVMPDASQEGERDRDQPPRVDSKRNDRQRRWPLAAIGLCAVVACMLAGWLLIDVSVPLSDSNTTQQAPLAVQPEADPVASDDVAIETIAATIEDSHGAAQGVTEQLSVPDEVRIQPQVDEVARVIQQTPVVAGRSYRENLKLGGQGPVMVELPAGSYEMGSVGNSLNFDEGPRHLVNIAAFSVGKYEVTFEEYDRFARATGRRLPYDESWGRAGHPVINVSWDDARAYARWLSGQTGQTYRLPSEAEWEYFTRAGSVASFWWHDESDKLHANCFNCGSDWDGTSTAPVGSFGANDFGLHDVTGNVQEWTADCYHGSYHNAPLDGSAWQSPECVMRVVRGGAYTSPLDTLRNAKRSRYDQDTRLDNLGFRVVREH